MNTFIRSLLTLLLTATLAWAQAPANLAWLSSTDNFMFEALFQAEWAHGGLHGGAGIITDSRSFYNIKIPRDSIGLDLRRATEIISQQNLFVRVTDSNKRITHSANITGNFGNPLFDAELEFKLQNGDDGWFIPPPALFLQPKLTRKPMIEVDENIRGIAIEFTSEDGDTNWEDLDVDAEEFATFATLPPGILDRIESFPGTVRFHVTYVDEEDNWLTEVYGRDGEPATDVISVQANPQVSIAGLSMQDGAQLVLAEDEAVPTIWLRVEERRLYTFSAVVKNSAGAIIDRANGFWYQTEGMKRPLFRGLSGEQTITLNPTTFAIKYYFDSGRK